jgi:hypothetical protein
MQIRKPWLHRDSYKERRCRLHRSWSLSPKQRSAHSPVRSELSRPGAALLFSSLLVRPWMSASVSHIPKCFVSAVCGCAVQFVYRHVSALLVLLEDFQCPLPTRHLIVRHSLISCLEPYDYATRWKTSGPDYQEGHDYQTSYGAHPASCPLCTGRHKAAIASAESPRHHASSEHFL